MSDKKIKCKLLPYEREDCLSIQDAQQRSGWSITAFDLPKAWEYSQGEGVVIAVLDTGCDLEHPDLKNNLLDGMNFVKPGTPPKDGNGHGCVAPDCLVHTNIFGITEIEELFESIDVPSQIISTNDGDYEVKNTTDMTTYSLDVQTQESCVGEIKSVQKLPIDGEIVTVTLEGGTQYRLTPWHPVYLSDHKHHSVYEIIRKRADEVAVGDHFIFGRGHMAGNLVSGDCRVTMPAEFVCDNCQHRPKWHTGATPGQCKKCHKKKWNFEPEELTVTSELAYMTGICLTDGHVNAVGDRFEISSNTKEIIEEVHRLSTKLGWTSAVEEKRALIYTKKASATMVALGVMRGKKSLRQTLPEWVGRANYDCVCAFLAGVIDGDGWISKSNTRNKITSASHDFAKKCAALLNSIGVSASVSGPFFDRRDRFVRSTAPIYQIVHAAVSPKIVEWLRHPVKKARCGSSPAYTRKFRRVKSVVRSEYKGFFYDFTVGSYHNYIADGHFVSNTHVTGILVAENNEIGMVGVCPKAKVRPVKVLDDRGNGNLLNVAEGIRWAADQGVDIITMSLGSPNKVQQIRKALQYAADKGIPTFVAAGNAGKSLFYPANYPETVAIGAIDEEMKRADFSNFGQNLDFMAPGVDIFSTVPPGWYATLSGTSMACPFAVGVAALVLSYVKAGKASFVLRTVDDYRNTMRRYTTPVKNGNYADPTFYEGFGIIDPRKLREASAPHPET